MVTLLNSDDHSLGTYINIIIWLLLLSALALLVSNWSLKIALQEFHSVFSLYVCHALSTNKFADKTLPNLHLFHVYFVLRYLTFNIFIHQQVMTN